ncbi:MAG: S9 family peptidase [Pseudomonadota bacterium]|nr:S9 family peptidase [Pseudomonadota bacterium]
MSKISVSLKFSTALLIVSICTPSFAQAQKPAFKPLDVFDLQWAADPQVSPDGRSVAYVRMGHDIKTDRALGSIWLVGIDGKNERPLSSAPTSGSPRWSPDGTRIAYVSRAADGSQQLFMYWAASGVNAPISNFTDTPGGLAWSPDGKWLVFTMPVAQERKPLKVDLPETPKNAKWADPPKFIDRMVFRADGEGYLQSTFNQVFIVSADGGAARQLSHGDFDHQGPPAFTTDGRGVLVGANRRADADYDPLDSEIYRIDVADGSIHALTDRRGPDRHPVPSPDGRHIAYLGFDDKQLGYQATQLYVMDSDGSHAHSLTASLDRDAASPQWLGDNKQLVFQYADHGSIKIAAIDLQGKLRLLADGVGGNDVSRPYAGGSFSISPNGRFVFTKASPNAPSSLATGTSMRDIVTLKPLSANLLAERNIGALEEISFDSLADHRRMQGWIVKPPGFDPSKKYPFVLEIHGGPFAMYAPSFAAEIQLYASAGYVVLYMNPRGSTGYGEEFANLIHHDYPNKDYDDLMSGVDALIARGYVDQERLFVTGGSGGGVLTAWIVGHTDRFRAAVVVKPVINWTSFVLTGDLTNYFYRYWFGEFPWVDMQAYWKRSPLAYVGNVKTPTMLMTGEVDYRTPSSEAEQFYQALKLRKVDTALVRVPNASHDISARPSLLIDKTAYILAWFKAHDVQGP